MTCEHLTAYCCDLCLVKLCWDCHEPAPDCEVIKTIAGRACDACKAADPIVARDYGPRVSR